MNERITELRKALQLTMEDFGKRLGVTRSAISNIESGKRQLTDQMVLSICREFNVSEEWLKTGAGEMVIPESRDELEALAKKYGYSAAVQVLIEKLVNLSPEQQEAVTDFLIEFAAGIQQMKDAGADPGGKAFPAQTDPDEMTIDEKVEAYRRALEEEKRAEGKSEVS